MSLNAADTAFAAQLSALLPEGAVSAPGPAYLEEPRGRYCGQGGVLVRPRNTEEVSTVLRAAFQARVPVVPYGGGTGLVGGQVAPEGAAPVILSLERMSAVRAIWPEENVLVAEAGAILSDVQAAAEAEDRLFALSLASEGSARIGGLLATNAGGINVLRYGTARAQCLGLEAVLPDGRIWHGLTRLYKDNTGYDLRDLMIGAEGTLGVITAAALRLAPRPARLGTAMMVVESPRAALALLALLRAQAGETVSAFEIIGGVGLGFLAETMPQVRQPFGQAPEWSVLIELGTGAEGAPEAMLEAVFAEALEQGLVSDGLIAQSAGQRAEFWAVREQIPEANRLVGSVSSHDISLPLSEIPDFIPEATAAIARLGPFRVNCFGHLGDGNLHYNVFPPAGQSRADYEDLRDDIKRTVHDLTHARGGSVSAEHGIGRLKVADLERYGDPVKRAAMRAIKDALDPRGIMNPGAVLR